MKRFSHLLKAAFLLLSLLPNMLSAQDALTIVAVGDVMPGTIYPTFTDLADEETAKHFFDEVKPYFEGGADVVLGHGPHVTRGMEIYNGKFIAYSMGNFATYSQIKIAGKLGIAPIFRIRMNAKTGDFIEAQVISTYLVNPNKGPLIDKEDRALKTIKSLSTTDFYDNSPTISNNGSITI